jgi:hypothetical protein
MAVAEAAAARQWQRRGGSVASAVGVAAAWRWRRQLGGSMAGATVVAERQQRRWWRLQWQCGGSSQLGGGGGSFVEARIQWQRQRFMKCGSSGALAAAAQQRQWQLYGGG